MRLRIVALVILCLCAGFARAQDPIAWRGYAPGFLDSQAVVDSDGSIFWVGTASSGGSSYSIHVIKYSPSGVRLADASRSLGSATNARTLAPALAGGRIFVGFAAADASSMMALETDDLAITWLDVMGGIDVQAIHATATQIVTLEDNGTTCIAQRRAAATGFKLGSTTLTSLTEIDQSVMDGSGNVYVSGPGATRSVSRLIRVNAAGGIHYDRSLSFVGYANRTAVTMNIQGGLVMVGYSAALVSQGTDALLYHGKLVDGSGSFWTINADYADSLASVLPQSDGSVIMAIRFSGTNTGDRIMRRNAAGVIWSIDHFNEQISFLFAKQDSSGNVVVGRRDPGQTWMDTITERRDPATGSLLWEYTITGIGSLPSDLDVTPTGNVLLSSAEDLYVVHGVIISLDRASVIGGGPLQLQVQLTRPTPVANLPVLFFSNAVELPVPASVNLPLGSTGTTVPINTLGVTATKVATVNVRHVGYIAQKSVTLLPPVLSTLVVSPVQVTGGTATQGTVTIAGDAPTGGWSVNLSSGNAAAVVPATATIPATLSSVQFAITTNPVSANTGVVISATKNSVTRTAFMAVNAPALTTFTLATSSIPGGQNGSLTVNLNGNAPTGGYSISLVSGAPALVVLPSSTAVPAGTTTRNLTFTTADVTASINVTLIAYRGNVVRTQTLTLTP